MCTCPGLLAADRFPSFLEKILLDFGVEGKITKISHGPVVSLNEFEPAPGIKVTKIINLAEIISNIGKNIYQKNTKIEFLNKNHLN